MPSTTLNLKNMGSNVNGSPLVAIQCTMGLRFLPIGQNFEVSARAVSFLSCSGDGRLGSAARIRF